MPWVVAEKFSGRIICGTCCAIPSSGRLGQKYIPRNMTGQTRYAMAIEAFYGVAGARTWRQGSADTPTAMCELPTLIGV